MDEVGERVEVVEEQQLDEFGVAILYLLLTTSHMHTYPLYSADDDVKCKINWQADPDHIQVGVYLLPKITVQYLWYSVTPPVVGVRDASLVEWWL